MIMNEVGKELDDDEIVEAVAAALRGLGLVASSQDTGGGICCVILERKGGGEIVWGTADFHWGASVFDENGEIISSIETTCPSDSQNIAAIAEAIKGSSIPAGAAS
jgi:hypothetical protein